MKSSIKNILTALFLITQCVYVYTQSLTNKMLVKVDSVFTSHYNDNIAAGAFAVIKNGDVIFRKTTGLANIEHRVPASGKTVFNIASNSKQFTALLALILEEEGKLSLQDDIRMYLPELKDLPHKITIKQLTNHTHGLPNVDELAQIKGINRMTHNEVLNMLFNIRQFNFIPGGAYQYSNTGYVLLSQIIERVGKKPYNEQLQQKIFDKLGMNDSESVGDYTEVIQNKAYSYVPVGEGYANNPVKLSTMGSSGVYASLDDLIKWCQNFIKTDHPYKRHLKKMQEPTMLTSGKVIEYGMGIQFENYKGIDIVFHGGGTESYRSYILHVPKHKLSFVFLSNTGGIAGYDIIYSSLEILLHSFMEKEQPFLKTADLTAYEGTYKLNSSLYLSVWAEKDSLYFGTYRTQEKTFLPQKSRHTFSFIWPFSKLTFHRDSFDLRFVDFTYTARRVIPPVLKNPDIDLSRYVGTYKNAQHESSFELVLMNGQLIVKHPVFNNVELTMYSGTVFYTQNSAFGEIDFYFDKDGNVKGCKLSRQNIHNIMFCKTK
ncbi:serine hydrolase domain-containing protein [Ascidiimonas aurantiaca]|uniref:serine hydrolase domain-containing protein n=1 Tax=Ascidiimonas aurantiaca TaxID=1685432 RepID=UPI0030EE7E68